MDLVRHQVHFLWKGAMRMKVFPLHQMNLEEAKQKQFEFVDAICREFSGYDVEVYLHNNYNWYFYVGVRTNICLDVRQ